MKRRVRRDERVTVHRPDPAEAGHHADLRSLYDQWLREVWPAETREANDNPRVDLELRPAGGPGTLWVATDRESASPCACLFIAPTDADRQSAASWLYVDPAHRRMGIAGRLLRRASRFVEREGISRLRARTTSNVSGGEALLRHLGGRVLISRRIFEAIVGDMDFDQLEWRSESFLQSDVRLEVYDGAYPSTDLDDLTALRSSIYRTYGLNLTDWAVQQTLIEFESIMVRRSLRRIGVFARESSTGRIVGIAETIWNPDSPAVLTDWFEAVVHSRRGRRLGAGLTAALLLEVRKRLPMVSVVRIGMHHSARSLHARTEEIGFHDRHSETQWIVLGEQIRAYASVAP